MCDQHPNSIHQKVKKRYGSAIEHGTEHQKAHRQWSRRDFLVRSGLATLGGALLLGKTSVAAVAANPLIAALNDPDKERILVLIRLKGGNDGLNTVIHRGNDEYYNIRPTLAISEADLWALDDDFGMPNFMSDLQSFWNNDRMKIIHNVGYPEANYSHFRSSDIWASASDSDTFVQTGWIGRFLDFDYPAFLDAPPVVPPALQIGVQSNLVFQSDATNMALAISNPTEFYQIAQSGQLYDTDLPSSCAQDEELAFVRKTANSAFRYSETIRQAYNDGQNEVAYPANNSLAEEMAIVARLIKGNLGTKIYMVSIGGFDTHADQVETHARLLNEVAGAVNAFFQDLDQSTFGAKTLAMTFSEFGRTIFENGSLGTDHGTGAPILIFGPNEMGSGFVGTAPDLVNVDMYGDPYFGTDFRSIYATMLQDWLGVHPEVVNHVMQQNFDTIEDLVPPASPAVGSNNTAALLGHNPGKNGGFEIKYAIQQRGTCRLRLLDQAGHPLRTLFNQFQERGSYTFLFQPHAFHLPPGQYVYQLDTGGRIYRRLIHW
ncbi:MAG: DUF1501 domain-containing protein [Bacteroidota bacterium]